MSVTPDSVTTVIPYSPEYTPQELLERAKDSVKYQSVDSEILVILDEESNGPSWARNQGIERADSRYVAFLDADDIWKEGKLERQLQEMRRKDAGICVQNEEVQKEVFMRELYLGNIADITSSIVIDTEKVRETRFNENIRRREDHLFPLEAASEGEICFCTDLFEVGGHDESFASNTSVWFRLREDAKFATIVRNEVPEVRDHLNSYYSNIRCNPTYSNTLGDVIRLMFMYPVPWTVPLMILSIICQRIRSNSNRVIDYRS